MHTKAWNVDQKRNAEQKLNMEISKPRLQKKI